MSIGRRLFRAAAAGVLAVLVAPFSGTLVVAAQAVEPPALAEARRLFDALDYEQVVPRLDQVIAQLAPVALQEPVQRQWLLSAYEMRARSRFGVGDIDGTRADFRALLAVNPAFTLDSSVSPRVVALLDEVKQATLGTLQLALEPSDAALLVDGVPIEVAPGGQLPVQAGAHMLRAMRPGYDVSDLAVTVSPGETLPVTFSLERVTSVLSLVTSPPGIEIVVNGQVRGESAEGILPEALAGVPGQLGVPPSQVSQPFVIADLGTGTYQLEFRRECYETERRTLTVESLSDLTVDPIRLTRAVGMLEIASVPPGADVRLDGVPRGSAPVTLEDICAGSHTVEIFGAEGRLVQRVELQTGETTTVSGRLRPAFALLAAPGGDGTADPRQSVAQALREASQIQVWAPEAAAVAAALKEDPVDALWFGLAEGESAPPIADRRLRLARLAERFGAQGLAWVEPAAPGSRGTRVALVAAGAAAPDVLTLEADAPASVDQALERLETPLALVRPSLGILTVDVLDVEGAVVARVDAGSPAEAAGLAVGDVVQAVGEEPVSGAADLRRLVTGATPGEPLTLRVAGPGGEARTIAPTVSAAPALLTGTDRFLPANVAVAALRARLASGSEDAAVIRLNLGAALLRAGDPDGARGVLQEAVLPSGPGVSQGAVQYLLGQAAQAAGDTAAARKAWEAAAQSEGRLTEDGPLVRSLAARALAGLP